MKILHTVEFYSPSTGGMQEVVKQLSENMAAKGHDVTVATTDLPGRKFDILNGVKIISFNISGNLVNGIVGDETEYQNLLLNGNFDIITNFAAQQWTSDLSFPVLDSIKAKKVFVPTGFSGMFNPKYAVYFEQMKTWMKKYDMNVFLSDNYRDVNYAKENGINERILIPNGAAETEFLRVETNDIREKFNIPKDDFLILHVGSYTGIKGHKEAVNIFLQSGIRDSYLLMCGDGNENFKKNILRQLDIVSLLKYIFGRRKKIEITSMNRLDIVKAYLAADLFLFPSQVECSPIVLFEAMASHTPFLTADVGNSEEIINWSNGGRLLPTKKDSNGYSHVQIKRSAKLVRQFYLNKKDREKLANSGFDSWKNKFTWEKIADQYLLLYKKLTQK